MNYYQLDEYDRQDDDFCFLTSVPDQIPLLSAYITGGQPAAADYPSDVQARMSDDRGGIVLSDIIANKNLSLIVHQTLKSVIETHCAQTCEYLPLSIINHKGRLASNEYYYINPLGTHDCLDLNKSDIEWSDDGEVIHVNHFVLDKHKMNDVPPLFRIDQDRRAYFINQKLVDGIRAAKPDVTNLNLEKIEVN
ncbi:MAG: hypothetical protein OEZ58_11980 [Gammaproteobacteria bacterium]|nr:hypothetical protein [Gammaproteobacteria bacterium]